MRQEVKVTYFSDIIGRFDKQSGMIYGVSVITEGKAKGHDLVVDSQTLMEIKNAAESFPDGRLKTKLNHRSGVEAVFGYLENFRVSGPKLLADLKMLKAHKDFEQTFEQISELPNQIGLSVAFVGKEAKTSSGEKLARCREILSADLVPEPAANPTGMFSAVVDTEKLDMSEQIATTGAESTQPTNAEIMDFLKTQVIPRIESTEQFQKAIQDELTAASEGGEEGDLKAGDDGTASAVGGAKGVTEEGGTRGGGAEGSPAQRAAAAAAAAGGRPATGDPELVGAAASEFAQLRDAVVRLERKHADKENEEREVQFESAMTDIREKIENVIEYAQLLEKDNTILLEALKSGVKPVKNSATELSFDTGKQEDFQSRVKKHVDAGKSKTEAVMLARKEDPHAHIKWLESQGVVSTL